jgi:hypothetical protein
MSDARHRWYRGDCHVHSVASNGGELTPPQIVAGAKAAGLDFIATTEHNTAEMHGAWGEAGDDLLVILGQEVTTRTGHWLALGIERGQVIDWRYGVHDDVVDQQLAAVHGVNGLCVAAHPYAPYPTGRFEYPYESFDAVEVWNGPWTSDVPWQADNEAALGEWSRTLCTDIQHGRWRPAVGNSDTHLEGQIGIPHNVVLADELSADGVLAGIRAGHSWIAATSTVDLSFVVAAGEVVAEIGERLSPAGEAIIARVTVRGVPRGEVSFHTDRGVVHREALTDTGSDDVQWHAGSETPVFIRVEVRDARGQMAALTNPIIVA